MNSSYSTLRLILGDQLNANHSWYKEKDSSVLYVVAELHQEQEYVKHHVQKIQAFFAAMESFSTALTKAGHDVIHLTLDDTEGQTLDDVIIELVRRFNVNQLQYQQPDEYRLAEQLSKISHDNLNNIEVFSTEHFFLEQSELKNYFKFNTAHRMEAFYRKLRKRFNILMDGDEPVGGEWNYDSANRNKMKQADIEKVPQPLQFTNDVSTINARLKKHNISTIGTGGNSLLWPINRSQAKELLAFFLDNCLPLFGYYQDAMVYENNDASSSLWSLYHSRVSFALNAKMLSPGYVIKQAITKYQNSDKVSVEQIEGFVRQILGWREFVRGIYWINMPSYKSLNGLSATNDLPDYFWDGNTKMACMSQAIKQSLTTAYAHHIQRLMVTGNFALISGLHPDQVDDWYLGIYIDAIEWVELPNTRGMSQFADGGLLASKAYAASGNYINNMSDYCKNCHYNVKLKTEDNACPFNALYWNFMVKHENKFKSNPRQSMVYRNWEKKTDTDKDALLQRADWILKNINKI